MGATRVYTNTVSSSIVNIATSDLILRLSVIVNSGSVIVTGSATFRGNNSTPITLSANQGLTLVVESISQPLDGIQIDATSGSCDIIMCTS
jgi:hypothetical protein